MANVALINQQVEDIIGTVDSMAHGGRIRYVISVLNPQLSKEPTDVFKGSNADNSKQQVPQDWYYGEEMSDKFKEQLKRVVNNPTNAKIYITIRDGQHAIKAQYEIVLREEFADYPIADRYGMPQRPQQPQQVQQIQQPQMPQQTSAIAGLGSVNELLSTIFGGLGTTEQTGLGAAIGMRDVLIRSEYERRDADREHKRREEEIRAEYERKDKDRQINEVKAERDEYKEKCQALEKQLEDKKAELEDKIKKANKELEKKEDTIYDLEDKIAKLEKMKPEASLAGVSLVGVGMRVAENLALKHAGTLGKLFGVDKDSMLGMLQADNEEPAQIQQQVEQEECSVIAEAEDENPRAGQAEMIKNLLYSLSDEEYEAFCKVASHLDEHRDHLMALAEKIN